MYSPFGSAEAVDAEAVADSAESADAEAEALEAEADADSAETAEEAEADAVALFDADPCEHPKSTNVIASAQALASNLVTVSMPSSVR